MTEARRHDLEVEYGLSKEEILDAISRRFRAKVTLEGAVAEVHLGKHIQALKDRIGVQIAAEPMPGGFSRWSGPGCREVKGS